MTDAPAAAPRTSRPRLALALSGGGARGFAHIGVLQALQHRGLHVDALAGTSMGAVLGAFDAAGFDAGTLYEVASDAHWHDIVDVSLQTGLMKGERLERFLSEHLPSTFEALDKPFAVTTTDVETGEERVLTSGPLLPALRAAACVPGAFEPVHLHGRTLADGAIVNNLPLSAAALLDAEHVIASDVTPPRRAQYQRDRAGSWWERAMAAVRFERRSPMVQMLFRSSEIQQAILTELQHALHPADLRIVHEMAHVHLESFGEFEEIVGLGRAQAERALDQASRDRPELFEPGGGSLLEHGA